MTDATNGAAAAKENVETVTMDDGSVVEFAGKRELLKASTITPDGNVQVKLNWRNGEVRTFTVPTALVLKFAAHGAEQKLGDEIAGLKGENGKAPDIEDKVLAIDELIERLNAGEWNVKRESNGLAGTSVLIRALVEFYGKPVVEVKAFLKDKTPAQKVALRNNNKIKPIVEKIEAAKVAKAGAKVDSEALLAAFGDGGATADPSMIATDQQQG